MSQTFSEPSPRHDPTPSGDVHARWDWRPEHVPVLALCALSLVCCWLLHHADVERADQRSAEISRLTAVALPIVPGSTVDEVREGARAVVRVVLREGPDTPAPLEAGRADAAGPDARLARSLDVVAPLDAVRVASDAGEDAPWVEASAGGVPLTAATLGGRRRVEVGSATLHLAHPADFRPTPAEADAAGGTDVPPHQGTAPPSLRFETVETPDHDYVASLRAWSATHPREVVAALSTVLAYRSDASALVLGTLPGDGASQRFDRIGGVEGRVDPGELADYESRFPGRRVVAFATVAAYSGGIGSLLVVSVPR